MAGSRDDRNVLDLNPSLGMAFQAACMAGTVEAWRKVADAASSLKEDALEAQDAEAAEDFAWVAAIAAHEVAARIGEEHEKGEMPWQKEDDEEELPTLREFLPTAFEEAQTLLSMAKDLGEDFFAVALQSVRRRFGLD